MTGTTGAAMAAQHIGAVRATPNRGRVPQVPHTGGDETAPQRGGVATAPRTSSSSSTSSTSKVMARANPGRHPNAPQADVVRATISRWRCRLSLTVRSPDPSMGVRCERLLTTMADDLEFRASRFRADSELARVNRAAGSWTDVSWSFVAVLTAAITAAERTGGLVDPCLGQLVDDAGYRTWRDGITAMPGQLPDDTGHRSWSDGTAAMPGRLPDDTGHRFWGERIAEPDPAPLADEQPLRGSRRTRESQPGSARQLARGCWQRIEVRPALRGARVRIPKCCQLDLGAIGKAWLADRLATRVVDQWRCDAVADMGGDIRAVGLHRRWTIAADPQLDGWAPAMMSVRDAGLATSGVGHRRWRTSGGAPAHHIVDPRTGRPADTPWWTASVLAADAKDANAAATAAIVLGADAPRWLSASPLDAWLVPAPDHPAPTSHRIGRWPSNEASR